MKKSVALLKTITNLALILTLVMVFTGINNTTYAKETNAAADINYDTSITYNLETKEIEYGKDQHKMLPEQETAGLRLNEIDLVSPNAIIGTDDRYKVLSTTASPYRNVCRVTSYFPDGASSTGSGVLTYFNVMLTAGHIAYSHDHGGWATSMIITPGQNGTDTPLGSAVATNMTCSNAWVNNDDPDWDWSIVDLSKSFDTWQSFGYYNDYNSMIGQSVQTIGYPSKDGQSTYMYTDTNVVIAAGERWCNVNCDVDHGDSGGPLIDVNRERLVGIITAAVTRPGETTPYTNRCIRINEDLGNRLLSHAH